MKRFSIGSNLIAGLLVSILVGAAAAVPLWGWLRPGDAILIHGQMAESGGWTPANLQARVGQTLHIRLTSDDVTHSFAIGQMELSPVDVNPGEINEVTLTFDRPGKYTFYCTRWCGPNHWRMRGVIEVSGPDGGSTGDVQAQNLPLYISLGLDIDQPHPAAVTPAAPPSPERGQSSLAAAPGQYTDPMYIRTHSPSEIWQALRSEPSLQNLDDAQVWDLTAAFIQSQTTPEMLAEGKRLFSQNCAACHGETGAGDGVMAESLVQEPMPDIQNMSAMEAGKMTTTPADFTNPATMLGASPAVLQGKIIRGGMGTGMPYWGPIFTEEQTWALVAYIQSLQFETEKQP